jgi:hypothetical protein
MEIRDVLRLRYGHRIRLRPAFWNPGFIPRDELYVVDEVVGHLTRPIICTTNGLHFTPWEVEYVDDGTPALWGRRHDSVR